MDLLTRPPDQTGLLSFANKSVSKSQRRSEAKAPKKHQQSTPEHTNLNICDQKCLAAPLTQMFVLEAADVQIQTGLVLASLRNSGLALGSLQVNF